jgi:hypothetical protein
MKRSPITPISSLMLGLLMLPGCPSPGPSNGNPGVLWLAPDMNETHVKLVDTEPGPF